MKKNYGKKLYDRIQEKRKNFHNPTFRNPLRMRNGLWIGFLIFSAIAALLFWTVLYMYYEVTYRKQITDDLDNTAWEIAGLYGEPDFERTVSILTRSNNYFAQVISEKDNEIIMSYTNEGVEGGPQSSRIADKDIFTSLDETDGYYLYYVEDEAGNSRWAAEAVVLANVDGYRHVLVLSCSTAEIDMLKQTLMSRGGISLAVVLALSAVFAFFLANFYARPFRHLNDAAREMAGGNFDTAFVPEGPQEAVQLAETLNLAEKEFRATEKLRRDFVANISHDMKTPLTVIRIYAEMIDAFSGEIPEKRAEHVRKITEETDRLTELINELMELSGLQSGTLQLQYEDFSMNELIYNVIDRIRIKDMSQGIEIRLYADTSYIVHADRQLIQRAVYNLIHNAVKYSGNSKLVKVRLVPQNNQLLVQIIDYGIGMGQEELKHIWERFYRSPDLGNHIRGNGIGLNIVSEIFKYHHIPYGAESRLGKGSTFWFII